MMKNIFLYKIIRPIKNPKNQYIKIIKSKLIKTLKRKNIYTLKFNKVEWEFFSYISDKISNPEIILEMGSRDGLQSIEFHNIFPKAKIYAFECNPPSIERCLKNTKNYDAIEIVPKAVSHKNEIVKFYPVIGNVGASSLFKVSDKYPQSPQKEIEVEAIRIDTWSKEKNINKIDLCWLDLQGAEYKALEGMGDLLLSVQALFLEVMHQEMYNGQKLFKDILKYLTEKKISLIKFHPVVEGWWGNAIFINNKLLK